MTRFVARRAAALPALLFLAASSSLAEAVLGAGLGYDETTGPSFAASAQGAVEAIGSRLALRLEGEGEASVALPAPLGAASFDPSAAEAEALGLVELSYAAGSLYCLGAASGGLSLEEGAVSYSAGLRGRVAVQALEFSASLSPRLGFDSSAEGGLELGLLGECSFLAADLVLKPRLDLSAFDFRDGSRALRAMPGLALSWYPLVPLSISFEAGYRREWTAEGAASSGIPMSLSLFASPLDKVFLRAGAEALAPLPSGALSDAAAYLELSFSLAERAGREIRLPLRLSYDGDAEARFGLYAGLELSFD